MGFGKLLPPALRIAYFYVKAKKVSKKQISLDEKKRLFSKLEESNGGEKYFLDENLPPRMPLIIGKKDIGKILLEIEEYQKALAYLTSAFKNLNEIQLQEKDHSYYIDNYFFITYYKAKAYCFLKNFQEAEKEYDKVNRFLNDRLATDPANARLNELYKSSLSRTYNDMLDAAEKYPDLANTYYNLGVKLFQQFKQRDESNEKILDLLNRLS